MRNAVTTYESWKNLLLCYLLLMAGVGGAVAAPPHPEQVKQIAAGKATAPYYLSHLDELRDRGFNAPYNPCVNKFDDQPLSLSPVAGSTVNMLAVVVDFTDYPRSVNATFFDTLIFGEEGTTVRDYYHEISFGQIDLTATDKPSSIGWITAPQTYSYYVDGQNGTGDYPRNTQKLVEDVVDLIDASVDFSQYDNDGDSFVDNLMVIHSGVGAEYTGGSSDDIWSHKYAITPRKKDGVYISTYTVQPEYWSTPGDMTIGVYAHELGHVFGLPDLYDTDYSSKGIGKWGLMSYGSWNGPRGQGGSPAHPCAWSRAALGVATVQTVTQSTYGQIMSDVATSGQVFKVPSAVGGGDEYFLVEYRKKTLYDSYLPGEGLLVWHIDESKSNNCSEWWPEGGQSSHYKVALEQADGYFDMEKNYNHGDGGDPFPGSSGATNFNVSGSPSSLSYGGQSTGVAIENISVSTNEAAADLIVDESAIAAGQLVQIPQSIELGQNYPNPFNPVTTIRFSNQFDAQVKLEIINILGQNVATILDEYLSAGSHSVIWEACDYGGAPVASGVYFYKMSAGTQRATKRMLLVR